jgi:hypothetical protein
MPKERGIPPSKITLVTPGSVGVKERENLW